MIIQKIENALRCGDNIPENEKALAEVIRRIIGQSYWNEFKEAVRYIMDTDMDKLTSEKLETLHTDFLRENNSIALYEKIKAEYDLILSEIECGDEDISLQNSYQVTVKENFLLFIESEEFNLTPRQFKALLSSQNTLHELYDVWCDNGEYNDFSDIGKCIAKTAERILS